MDSHRCCTDCSEKKFLNLSCKLCWTKRSMFFLPSPGVRQRFHEPHKRHQPKKILSGDFTFMTVGNLLATEWCVRLIKLYCSEALALSPYRNGRWIFLMNAATTGFALIETFLLMFFFLTCVFKLKRWDCRSSFCW